MPKFTPPTGPEDGRLSPRSSFYLFRARAKPPEKSRRPGRSPIDLSSAIGRRCYSCLLSGMLSLVCFDPCPFIRLYPVSEAILRGPDR